MAKTVIFQKVCRGLYMSHERGMTLSHEAVWDRAIGRKWVLTYKVTTFALLEGNKVTEKFNTIAEARARANRLLQESK